jgi:hypothetical protein
MSVGQVPQPVPLSITLQVGWGPSLTSLGSQPFTWLPTGLPFFPAPATVYFAISQHSHGEDDFTKLRVQTRGEFGVLAEWPAVP